MLQPAAAAALAVAAGAAPLLSAPEPMRLVATWSFLAVGPGLALLGTSGLGGPLAASIFALALSLTVDGLVACLLLYAGAWSPARGLALLIGLSLGASWLRLWRLGRAGAFGQPSGQAPVEGPGTALPGRTSLLIALAALAILAVLAPSARLGADPQAVVGIGSAVLLIALLSEEELASAGGRRRAGPAEWTRLLVLALLLAAFLVGVTLRSARLLQLGRPGGQPAASASTATPPPPGLTTPTP
ncbi:MAG TPA: hypothetical protein VGL23_06460 [Chloroflexota bacterium]|jgi:hypothetical protein